MYIKYILCIFDNRKKQTIIHLKKQQNDNFSKNKRKQRQS
jgi:hypothetical protein